MTAMRVALVLLAFLLSTRGDVRARDPEVEQEEDEQEDWGTTSGVISATEETPLMQDGGNYPARSGNWCAFVQKRVVTVAVACGTEKYTIKSQSPCPSGTPDCHLVMYKLSTRPLYRQQQKETTALLWRCCPGHRGDNCDDTVADTQIDSANSSLIGGSEFQRTPESLHTAGVLPQQQHSQPNSEQNDHQGSVNTPHNVSHVEFPVHVANGDRSRHQEHAQPPVYVPNQDRAQYPAPVPNQDRLQRPAHVAHQDRAPHGDRVRTPVRLPHSDPVRVQERDPGQYPVPVQYPIHVQDREPARNPVRAQYPVGVREGDPERHRISHPAGKHEQQESLQPGAYQEEEEEAEATSHPAVPAALPLPHMVALLMSQLQRPLQLFNHSLEQLDRRLGELARDVAELKGARRLERDLRDDYERRLDAKVEQSVRQVAALREQLESGLHSQQAMLHYNMSNLKADLDLKLKRHNKMLQASLQAMNATLAELKLDQELEQEQQREQEGQQEAGRQQEARVEAPAGEAHAGEAPAGEAHAATSQVSTDALWDAIERLDNRVVNNTIAVDRLAEDLALTSGGVRQLRRDAKALGERLNQTARTGQVLFMETGLEVEAAKVAVLERVEQLAGNLSRQGQRLHELDVDVDYLYAVLYKNNASSSSPPQCDCGRLGEAVARLEGGVANATELATENRLALEDERRAAAEARPWEAGAGDWETAVEALQTSLQQVKESMTSEQSRTTTLESSVRRLGVLLQEARARAETRQDAPSASDGELREEMKRVLAEMKRLSASFNSLLKDVIRHSDVLEILLGEEVLEFLEWPAQDQEAHSIPALKERLGALRQTSDEPGDAEEAPSADAPSFRSNEGGGPMSAGDGGDLWKLERSVEQLEAKLQRLEEAPCCRDAGDGEGEAEEEEAALRTEVARLKRGLEEHLRTFKDVLGNADVLERSAPRTVAAQGKKKRGRGGHHRNGREAPGEAHRLT
ncbi:multimerin-2-like [Hippocampus comes]|uniref:multimerin-2-like n=1 Tax=Hippocampus comes TaxID=109280 RepID=UPI00094E5454|nr:PREDICTED: multimerin-2-like [Hippocampus comes]